MQALTASPRTALTTSQVTDVLTGPSLSVSAGLELLDTDDVLVEDISDDLLGGTVQRSNYANVHATVSLSVSRALSWGAARVRPYMTLSNDDTDARFNLGVYVLATPERQIGETPETFGVQGYDKLYLLQGEIGDTYTVASGVAYLTAIRDVITASGVGGQVLLDATAAATTLPAARVWPLVENEAPTYLRVINDLLAAIGYRGLWTDENGAFRSEPYQAPSVRAVEWTFDADDECTTLVGEDRAVVDDLWDTPNWWRFVRRDLATEPTEGAGFYTVTNQSDGQTSIDALGYTRRRTVFLDAANQASLVAQGDRIVQTDRRRSSLLNVTTAPLPIAGHFDVASWVDSAAGGTRKVLAQSWELPLTGEDMRWTFETVDA